MKLLRTIKRKIRTLRKRYLLKKFIKEAGGNEVRNQSRNLRLIKIRQDKRSEIASLVTSWKLKEIKPPTDEEYYKFFFENSLSLSYINSVRRKYWEDH
jgi:hypothetical protein